MRRPIWIAVLTLTAAALSVPASAQAATSLSNGAVVLARTPQEYTYSARYQRWSVVAVQSAPTSDWDLHLLDKPGTVLATSVYGLGATDFVTVDSNAGRRPAGSYRAQVTEYTAGPYWVQQRTGNETITLPPITHHGVSGPGDPDLAFSVLVDHDLVSVADIYLTAGEQFWAHTTSAKGQLYLVGDSALSPATWVQSRATASGRQETEVLDGCTRYTAENTGWHALVQVGDRSPSTHIPTQGTAYALHRVDPASPASCPQRNFPDPTP
jgi:hypothetical protein